MQNGREGLTVGPDTPDNQARGTTPDAESEMPSRRYSIDEAVEALAVTTQTLQRWLRTTDTDIKSERDPIDRRLRWLNRMQVTELSRRHNRGELRPSSRIEQHLIARLRDCERRIEELETIVERLQGGASFTPLEPYTPRPPREASRTRPLGPITTLDELPEGWVAWSRWAQDHDVPIRTMQTKVHGDPKRKIAPVLAFHRGPWRSRDPRPVLVTEALDPEQQEAARLYFGK